MKIVGIDPGLTGAIASAFWTGERMVFDALHDMPVTHELDGRPMPCGLSVYNILRDISPDFVILEHVESRPGQGSTSAFRFAQGFGATLAACQCAAPSKTHLVRPRMWKAALSLTGDKNESLELARSLFPSAESLLKRKKDDGRAEALLLTHYYSKIIVARGEMEVI